MRTNGLVLAAAAALFVGCSSTSEDQAVFDAFVDAAYRRNAAELARPATPPPKPAAVDAVTGALLTTAYKNFEELRRIACANVANVHTVAYKRQVAQVRVRTVTTDDGFTYQSPCIEGVDALFTQGTIYQTGRSLDVAIDGDGFFSVTLPGGAIGYTRDGNLHLDAAGRLVTGAGHVLQPQVTAPSDLLEVSIDQEGRVSGRTAGAPDVPTAFGQLEVHRFADPSGLRPGDDGVLRAAAAVGAPTTGAPGSGGLGLIKQGFLEGSNVELTSELMDLQRLNRQQDSLTRVLAHFGMIAP